MSCEAETGYLEFPPCYTGRGLMSFDIAMAVENSAELEDAYITFRDSTGTVSHTMTVGSGLALDDTTAGAWNITVSEISDITLAADTHSWTLTTVEVGGLPMIYLAGIWSISTP